MSPRTPLINPKAYFEDHSDPIIPGGGVFALYVLGTIVFLFSLIELLLSRVENIPSRAVNLLYDSVVGLAIFTIPVAIISLLIVAAVMHFWVRSESPFGTYGGAVAVAAWSYAPDVLSLPVRFLLAAWQLRGLTFDASDPEQYTASLQAMQSGLDLGSIVIEFVVIAWSVYILSRGITKTHGVDPETAMWPALIVGVGALLLRLTG